jgi:hypothetical protein
MSTDLTEKVNVVDRLTGEIIDVQKAPTEVLAGFVTNLQALRKELADAESLVSDELVDRLDRNVSWTLRVSSKDGAWEIKAPSPTAGTTVYPEDMLETALEDLVDDGMITPEAAAKALHRRIVLELGVPWDADPREMARKVKEAISIDVAGIQVNVERSEARITPVASSINALRKVPGTIDALDKAQREQPPTKRRATVKSTSEIRDRLNGEKGTL